MRKLNLKSIVWKEDKYYVAQCLNVDVSSFGVTKIQALKNLQEAVALYFDDKKVGIRYIFRGFLEKNKHKIPLFSNGILCSSMLTFNYAT